MLENSYPTPSIVNYNCIRRDRIGCDKDNGGGLLTFIRKNIQYESFRLVSAPKNFEYIAIKIKTQSCFLHLVATYNPPYNIIETNQFLKIFNEISSLKNSIIIGDLNTQNQAWGSSHNNALGNNLLTAIDKNGCFRILNNGKPTRIHNNNSCPDVSISTLDIEHRLHWDVVEDSMGSDHFPLSIELDGFSDHYSNGKTRFRLSKIRWEDFNDFILKNMGSLPSSLTCIDEALSSFIDIIQKGLVASGGSSSTSSSSANPQTDPIDYQAHSGKKITKINSLKRQYENL